MSPEIMETLKGGILASQSDNNGKASIFSFEISVPDHNVCLFWHVGYDSHSEYQLPDMKKIGTQTRMQPWKHPNQLDELNL